MPEGPPASQPSLAEAVGWLGFRVEDAEGRLVGRLRAVFADTESGAPAWLIVSLGRWRGRLIPVPARNCAGAAGRVWTAHGREALRSAPMIDARRPLLREHELAICAHYGIGERLGRGAETVGRPAGAITSRPV
jgi:PRC-barrel domain protein